MQAIVADAPSSTAYYAGSENFLASTDIYMLTYQQAEEIKRAGPVDPQAKQERKNHKTMPAPPRTVDRYEKLRFRCGAYVEVRWFNFVDRSIVAACNNGEIIIQVTKWGMWVSAYCPVASCSRST